LIDTSLSRNHEGGNKTVAIEGKDPRLVPYGQTNLGMALDLVDGLAVPNDLFFVRSNYPLPTVDPAQWRLRVDGLVDRELNLTLDDVKALPSQTQTAFLECAGDSRSRFEPQAEGTPWQNDAVGNATWTGTALRHVLDMAGLQPGAIEIITQGGDTPEMQRGLPLGVALNPSTMLVWEMNGQPLPQPNGGPMRLLVPGWCGISSTKWIVGITVIDRPFAGKWNTENYTMQTAAGERVRPVREMPVKSIISTPAAGSTVPAGPQQLAGYAWSGYGGITQIEVSTDGGLTWHDACITEEAGRLSWVRFAYDWEAEPGTARLQSRATDERGLIQPESAAWNARGYLNNSIYEVAVTVS
jgi:DMSO/TMAO reductase YedYZ molybdopterin-dependent catalytic subunit